MRIYFVSETYLKDETPIGENVDIKKVVPFLKTACYMRLEDLLGEVFLEDLLTKYEDESLSADEEALVDKCRLVVSWYASSMVTPRLNNNTSNKGQQRQSGDYSTASNDNSEKEAQDQDSVTGRFWRNKLAEYLDRNKSKFPVYTSKLNQDTLPANKKKVCETTDPNGYNDSMFII